MKKILFTILFFVISIFKIKAIENIKINNESLSPQFDSSFKKYNYFTDEDIILIDVKKSKNENISGDGTFILKTNIERFVVTSSIHGEYEITVYKNYEKYNGEFGKLLNLKILNYNIDFNSNIYEYDVVINDEDMLNIEYELSNLSSYVDIKGNGNFNQSKNIIEINVDNINTYKINVLKTNTVLKENIDDEDIVYLNPTKKEIVKLLIITISCSFVFLMYYLLFIKKLF